MSAVHGKVAVVTGAGSGIGRALALELAHRGARLALSDIDELGLAETADLLMPLGADVRTRRLDVADRPAVEGYGAAGARCSTQSGRCTTAPSASTCSGSSTAPRRSCRT